MSEGKDVRKPDMLKIYYKKLRVLDEFNMKLLLLNYTIKY